MCRQADSTGFLGNCISRKARMADVEPKQLSLLSVATLQIVKHRAHQKSN
ncbi:hypothetical protein Golob_026482, partial [Gossypium lobatum]|nr:hypothetical protein [Gossypium lobatum]